MWSNFVKTGNPTPPAAGGPADGGPTLQGNEDIVWRPVMPAASEVQQYITYSKRQLVYFERLLICTKKKENKFSSYLRKFRVGQLQSHI
jgi:hypothetical protein